MRGFLESYRKLETLCTVYGCIYTHPASLGELPGGGRRLRASREVKLKEIDCIILPALTSRVMSP